MAERIVIVGGGFGGLAAARGLARAPVEVTLIDRRNFHLFQPLLYQVATGGLSPGNVAAPLRWILRHQRNARVLLGEVRGIDPEGGRVLLDHSCLPFDRLILAAGSSTHYFDHPEWESRAPGLKTVEDAVEIRRRLLLAFEEAERTDEPQRIRPLLTFLVVGGGPTGTELAGALAEIARFTLRREFRRIDPALARVLLVEGGDRILASYPERLSRLAREQLESLGVEVRVGTLVTGLQPDRVRLEVAGIAEEVPTRTVVWAAGVRASRLARRLEEVGIARLDRSGRVEVDRQGRLPGDERIFVIGDLARMPDLQGEPLPGVAPVALQQGRYVARVIRRELDGRAPPPTFRYRDRGSMAVIGRRRAVAHLGRLRFGGWTAWFSWLLVHLMLMVGFGNRLLILIQWAWSYFTYGRSVRLITWTRMSRGKPEERS